MTNKNGNKIKIVCMGDSITEGYGLGEDQSFCYPSILQELLGDNYEVYNKGVSGSCTTNTCNEQGQVVGMPYQRQPRYTEALELRGDIYILMLGTNDAQDGSYDDIEGQDPCNILTEYAKQFPYYMQSIIDDIHKANKQAVIYLVKPVPVRKCIWRKHQQRYLDRLLPYYQTIVESNDNMHLIKLYEAFCNYKEVPIDELYQEDGLHPNSKGARLIANVIYEGLH